MQTLLNQDNPGTQLAGPVLDNEVRDVRQGPQEPAAQTNLAALTDTTPKVIRVERTADYSDWTVYEPENKWGGCCIFHSSGQGYKGRTPQEKIAYLVREISDDLQKEGYTHIVVKEVIS